MVILILKSDKNIVKEETKDPYPYEHRQTENILNIRVCESKNI